MSEIYNGFDPEEFKAPSRHFTPGSIAEDPITNQEPVGSQEEQTNTNARKVRIPAIPPNVILGVE